MNKKISILLYCFFFYFAFSQPLIDWIREYDSGADDYAEGVASDAFGNIIVTGSSYNGVDFDCFTIKYNSSGDTLWTRRFDTGGSDMAEDVAVDDVGNIIVVGTSRLDTIYDYLIIKYSDSGDLVWMRRYHTVFDNFGIAVAIDYSQNIVVTGYSYDGASYDYLTVKYSPLGDTIWSARYDAGSNDIAEDVAVDINDNVIVTGSSFDTGIAGYTIRTVKYDQNGDSLWVKQYTYSNYANIYGSCVATYQDSNILVLGSRSFGVFFIIKYSPAGDTIWRRWNQWYDVYVPRDIAIDSSNNFYITGEHKAQIDFSYNYRTGKFSPDGALIWRIDYQYGYDDPDEFARGVTIDSSDNIIVTGYTDNGDDYDYLTIKYTEESYVREEFVYDIPGNFKLYPPYPNPFNSQTTIKYTSPCSEHLKIGIYDINGRLVKSFGHFMPYTSAHVQTGGTLQQCSRVVWDGKDNGGQQLPSGVYFVRLETPERTETRKIVKLK